MPYFTTDELRALPDVNDESRFSNERLEAARNWIEAVIERECQTSFVPRTHTETLSGGGATGLFLSHPYVIAASAVSVDGVALDSDAVEALVVQHGALYNVSDACWSPATRGNITVTYTAGYSTTPPADLKEAALRAARNWLLTNDAWSGKDTRTTSITNEYGNMQLSVAGPDRPTGLPDVDAVIVGWRDKVRIPGVA